MVPTINPQLLQPSDDPDLPHFFNASVEAAEAYREGQAFQQISFKGEHAVVNRQWVERCMCVTDRMDVLLTTK